jgi:hypothetical protein
MFFSSISGHQHPRSGSRIESLYPDPPHCRKFIYSSCREERERLTGEKVAQLLCPDEEEIPSQEEAVRYGTFL